MAAIEDGSSCGLLLWVRGMVSHLPRYEGKADTIEAALEDGGGRRDI